MDRSHAYSGASQRRRHEQQFYQSQPPPPPPQLQPQPQSQLQIQNHLQQQQPPQSQQQQRSSHFSQTLTPYRNDLKNLANKLGVKNGGYPPGYVEPKTKKVKYNNGDCSNDRERGAKIVQRGFKFSEDQRRRLNEYFANSRYPKPNDMEILAYELNVKREQIKNWFHDQRRKYKKSGSVKVSPKKPMFSAQQRKRLEEFFEKNFHPYPGDSRKLVNEFEFKEDQVHFRYEDTHMRYDCLNTNEKVVQSRGFKFSDDQRARLRAYFDKNRYPNPYDMERLAYELDVKKEQVKNWFHDQRRKFKRENAIR